VPVLAQKCIGSGTRVVADRSTIFISVRQIGRQALNHKPAHKSPVVSFSLRQRTKKPPGMPGGVQSSDLNGLQALGANTCGATVPDGGYPAPASQSVSHFKTIRSLGGTAALLRFCCKSRKLQGPEFFAKTRNGKRSLIRMTSIALSKSPVSLTSGDEVPHIFTRKPRLQPAEFLITSAKRVLQHNPPTSEVSERSQHDRVVPYRFRKVPKPMMKVRKTGKSVIQSSAFLKSLLTSPVLLAHADWPHRRLLK
jgi:hypothetical protein